MLRVLQLHCIALHCINNSTGRVSVTAAAMTTLSSNILQRSCLRLSIELLAHNTQIARTSPAPRVHYRWQHHGEDSGQIVIGSQPVYVCGYIMNKAAKNREKENNVADSIATGASLIPNEFKILHEQRPCRDVITDYFTQSGT